MPWRKSTRRTPALRNFFRPRYGNDTTRGASAQCVRGGAAPMNRPLPADIIRSNCRGGHVDHAHWLPWRRPGPARRENDQTMTCAGTTSRHHLIETPAAILRVVCDCKRVACHRSSRSEPPIHPGGERDEVHQRALRAILEAAVEYLRLVEHVGGVEAQADAWAQLIGQPDVHGLV